MPIGPTIFFQRAQHTTSYFFGPFLLCDHASHDVLVDSMYDFTIGLRLRAATYAIDRKTWLPLNGHSSDVESTRMNQIDYYSYLLEYSAY